MTYEISVNLATHNRAAFLEKCLVSLCEQALDPARYEICVVANACTDNTPEIVAKIAELYPRHRVFMVEEPVPGLSRARNTGLRATTGDFVAHVDDDGTVGADWLPLILRRFAELLPETAVVTGEIDPVWSAPRPAWLTDKMMPMLSARTSSGTEPHYLAESEWYMEGNSCYRRRALLEAGGFPENLGRTGNNLLSGEGHIADLVRKNGWRIFFDPDLILRHFIHADRLQPLWFRRRSFWQGITAYAGKQYKSRIGLPFDPVVSLNLPLATADWSFLAADNADNLDAMLDRFHDLGFVLAMSGIIPIEI